MSAVQKPEFISFQRAQERLSLAIGGLLLATCILVLPSFFQHSNWPDVATSLKETFSNKYTLLFSGILTASALTVYGIYVHLRHNEKREPTKKYPFRDEMRTFHEIYGCERSSMMGASMVAALLTSAVVSFTFAYLFSPAFRDMMGGRDLFNLSVTTLGATSLFLAIIKARDVHNKSLLITNNKR